MGCPTSTYPLFIFLLKQLTSARRARASDLPHFRLNKVQNIKSWLSIRSFLKRRGPTRSVDIIVRYRLKLVLSLICWTFEIYNTTRNNVNCFIKDLSFSSHISVSFLVTCFLILFMCVEILKNPETFLEHLYNWEMISWGLVLGFLMLRLITLGSKINKKYRNLSVLLTEQINLYLQVRIHNFDVFAVIETSNFYLDAFLHLYNRFCLSVRRSVSLFVSRSVEHELKIRFPGWIWTK